MSVKFAVLSAANNVAYISAGIASVISVLVSAMVSPSPVRASGLHLRPTVSDRPHGPASVLPSGSGLSLR